MINLSSKIWAIYFSILIVYQLELILVEPKFLTSVHKVLFILSNTLKDILKTFEPLMYILFLINLLFIH